MPILTPVRRGLIYFCLHVTTFVAMLAVTKPMMQDYGFGEVLFVRNAVPWLIIASTTLLKPDFRPWRSNRWKGHLLRGSVGFVNMVLLYLSVKLLPLALALTIRQLEAFLWVAFASFIYHEKVSRRQWLALPLGLAGVLLVLRPAMEANITGALVALSCAVTGAYVRVLSRELSRTENSTTIIFFNFTQWTILSACIAPWAWTMPGATDLISLLLVGFTLLASHWLMTEGMALVPAPRLAPFRHTEIFWAGLLGWLVWQEPISPWFVAGSALIVIGGVTANWGQRKLVPV